LEGDCHGLFQVRVLAFQGAAEENHAKYKSGYSVSRIFELDNYRIRQVLDIYRHTICKVKVKLSLCLTNHDAMKTYGGVEAVDGGE